LERAVGSEELQKPQRDKEGNAVFELNSKKKVRVSKFKGQVLIDFREYWQTPTGETMPTKKGVSLTLDAYNQLKALIPSIDA
jgi:Transcriptional Coactivator p15 (PC4)